MKNPHEKRSESPRAEKHQANRVSFVLRSTPQEYPPGVLPRQPEMKNRTLKTPSRTPEAPSNSDEETNFRLLTGGGGGDLGNSSHTGEEDVSDEEEEDGDSEASDDEGAVSPEITTREDMKKGALAT